MRRQRVGGVLAALCVFAGASGVLAIGLLAPPNPGAGRFGDAGAPSLTADAAAGHVARSPFDPNAVTVAAASTAPPESFVTHTSGVPTAGEATASGCSAALEYLDAYAAPGFSLVCPGNAQGHQAMTQCVSGASRCGVTRLIVIADPCPNAYMNEASNSWALLGATDAPLDPYGACS